jgi:hypothetical protein
VPASPAASQGVRRRRVFYIGGYDPRSPAYYHGLYQTESRRQGLVTGAQFQVGPRRNQGELVTRWTITAHVDGSVVETDYWLLRWDDLVRARWKQSTAQQIIDIIRRIFSLSRAGFYPALARQGVPAILAGLFPATLLAIYSVAFVGVMSGLVLAVLRFGTTADWRTSLVAILAPVLLLAGFLPGWRWLDQRLAVSWLNRCFGYMLDRAGNPAPDEDRCAAFARTILEAGAEPDLDEVLLVGHSQGTLHAIRTAARLLILNPDFGTGSVRFSLLTLGQPFAIYTRLPDDEHFRADLALVATSKRLVWLDETSPADPVSSCGVDPLIGLEVEHRLWPIRKSPRFHLLLSGPTYRQIKMSPFAFHFQYIKAGEIAGDYDFFHLTAGPALLLAEQRS